MITPGFETTQLSSSNSVRRAALGAGLQGKYGAVARIAREFRISNSALQKNHWDERTQRNPRLRRLRPGAPQGTFAARACPRMLQILETGAGAPPGRELETKAVRTGGQVHRCGHHRYGRPQSKQSIRRSSRTHRPPTPRKFSGRELQRPAPSISSRPQTRLAGIPRIVHGMEEPPSQADGQAQGNLSIRVDYWPESRRLADDARVPRQRKSQLNETRVEQQLHRSNHTGDI